MIDGGTGTDTISFSTSLSGVTVDLRLGIGSGPGDSAGDTYANVENIDGSDFDDSFTPNAAANEIDGKSGSDLVDYFHDTAALRANLTNGVVSAGGLYALGDRLIRIEHLSGTDGFGDDLTGSFFANTLLGHGGDDFLEGLAGADILDGGAGNDTARYDSSNTAVTVNLTTGMASGGHAQGDTLLNIENLIGSYANDALTGNAFANIFDGGDGFDRIYGMAGDDVFVAGRGADQMDGGAGQDSVQFAGSLLDNAALPVLIDLLSGTDNFGNSYSSVENILSGSGNDTLTGSADANLIDGGAGNDTLSDGGGADTLRGGAGNDIFRLEAARADFADTGDSFDGGSGTDTLMVEVQSGTDVFDMAAGLYTRQGHLHSVVNFEHADSGTLNSAGSLHVYGTSSANTLSGGLGDDRIEGRGGGDVLAGGAGHDTLSYESSLGAVTVDLGAGSASGGDASGDTFTGFEALIGSAFDDVLAGDANANHLRGGGGEDTLRGSGGLDSLYGEDGADALWVANTPAQMASGALYDGGQGQDALVIHSDDTTARHFDLTDLALHSLERLLFFTDAASAGDLSVALSIAQSQAMTLQEIGVLARHGSDTFTVQFHMGDETVADLSAFAAGFSDTLALLGDNDAETVTGSAAGDMVQLAAGDDTYVITGGADSVDLGAGADSFVITDLTVLEAGALYQGGLGMDQLGIQASGLVDLSATFWTGLETLAFAGPPAGARTVSLTATQALTAFPQITGSTAQDHLSVTLGSEQHDWDFSSLAFSNWTPGHAGQTDLVTFTGLAGPGIGQSITGTDQADLFSAAGGDLLFGGAGDDRFAHANGAELDHLTGGTGWDIADYSAETLAAVDVSLFAGTASRGGGGGAVMIVGVEEIRGSQLADRITGDAGDNIIDGGDGDDTLTGGGGQDTVLGGDGDDVLIDRDPANLIDHYDGGAGRDTLQAMEVSWGAGVLFDLTTGLQTTNAGATISDSFTSIENLTVSGAAQLRGDGADNILSAVAGPDGGEHDNILIGEGGNDTLYAGDGNDILQGGFGDDSLMGEAGDDILSGGAGNDRLDGGVGVDTASYAAAGGRVAVFLARAPQDLGSGQGIDTFVSIENVIGTNFDDRLVGDAANNVLDGGRGDDVLIGQAGNDTLIGGNGEDTLTGSGGDDLLMGGNGNDVLDGLGGADTFDGGGGNDTLLGGLGVDTMEGGGGADDMFGNFGADTMFGGIGNDNIRADGSGDVVDGGAGNDRIVGGNGKDTLFGGAGNDTLFGGAGTALGDGLRDVFVFKTAEAGGGGFDIIRDFEDTIDKLDFSESGYTSFGQVAADATQVANHVEITLDFGGLLRLEDFSLSDLTAGDFLF